MLSGKLVRLRPVEEADIDRVYVWINDWEVKRWLAGPSRYPFSYADEQEWIKLAVRRTKPPEMSWSIITLDDGRHIGSVGLHGIDGADRNASLGIMIGEREYWSHGYGTDTIVTLLRYAFDEMNLHRVWLQVHADNARGIACYRKCGFIEEGRTREDRFRGGRWCDTLTMGVLEHEFRALYGGATLS
jgi:RimJ/RimL family protein N-acetyltransferase